MVAVLEYSRNILYLWLTTTTRFYCCHNYLHWVLEWSKYLPLEQFTIFRLGLFEISYPITFHIFYYHNIRLNCKSILVTRFMWLAHKPPVEWMESIYPNRQMTNLSHILDWLGDRSFWKMMSNHGRSGKGCISMTLYTPLIPLPPHPHYRRLSIYLKNQPVTNLRKIWYLPITSEKQKLAKHTNHFLSYEPPEPHFKTAGRKNAHARHQKRREAN